MNFVIFVKSDAMMAEIKSDFLQSDEYGFRFASSSPVQPGFNISQLHDPGSAAFPSAGEWDSNHSHPACTLITDIVREQVKTRFSSFPLLSRQSPGSRASADFGSLFA